MWFLKFTRMLTATLFKIELATIQFNNIFRVHISMIFSYLSQEYCFTALCVACQNGHAQIVTILIDNGADVNHQTQVGILRVSSCTCTMAVFLQDGEWTPLLLASYKNQTDVLELLINHGAQLDTVNSVSFVKSESLFITNLIL